MAQNFITNSQEKMLEERLKTLIKCSTELKFLVGFFYFSAIRPLYEKLKEIDTQKVDQILSLTQSPDYEINKEKQEKVKELEKEIDQIVYKLYGLTEEEIKIIEGGYHGYEQSE